MNYDVVRNIIQLFTIRNNIFKFNKEIKTIDNIHDNSQYIFVNNISNENGYSFLRVRTIQILHENRQKNENTRIQEIFMEIDQLGNYTQSEWFSELSHSYLSSFIHNLYDIWNYRSNMSYIVRTQICPYYNPFLFEVDVGVRFGEELKKNCIIIMENILFSGGDIEYRKLGCIHILTALTLVSRSAQRALPWLYESAVFNY